MEIQQHDGVVVDAGVTGAGLRRSTARGRGVAGEREAPRVKGAAAPPSPPLYRPPRGRRPWEIPSPRGAAAKGVACPPSQVGRPHP